MTGKQRAYLKGLANSQHAVINVGKTGVTPELVLAVDEALSARELVKIGVLESCEQSPAEAAEMIAGRTRSELVQVIGRKFIVYRKPKPGKQAKIILPQTRKGE